MGELDDVAGEAAAQVSAANERQAEAQRLTDTGNGHRLARRTTGKLHWVDGMGWLWWDGRRWKRDKAKRVHREAEMSARAIYQEAAACSDPEVAKAISKWAHQSQSAARIDAAVKIASWQPEIVLEDVKELDAHANLLNVANGILDLDTLEVRPHDPKRLLTKLARAGYRPDAECPFWEQTLEYFLPDPEVRRWVQMAAGYSMLGSYSEWLFIAHGAGANGKSTFLYGLRDALGDYAMEAPGELLTASKGKRSAGEESALAQCQGRRLITTVETEQGKRMAEALMKQLTGESTITAKYMRENMFEFDNQMAIWIATNHKPVVQGTDFAAWRRIRLIPFTVVIPERHRKPEDVVKRTLRAERDGILRWLVDGLRRYREQTPVSLDPAPTMVDAATAVYRQEMDAVGLWLSECCVLDPKALAPIANLRESYRSWCETEGRNEFGSRRFNEELEERGLRRSGVRLGGAQTKVWTGVKLIGTFLQGDGQADDV